jgi:hypothetical protein
MVFKDGMALAEVGWKRAFFASPLWLTYLELMLSDD